MEDALNKYLDLIRSIPDFPKKGIVFKDITPLIKDPEAFASVVNDMTRPFINDKIDIVVAVEARGYIFGAPIANRLNCGFVPVRKPGKLPYVTSSIEYSLEYGTETLEIHQDAIDRGQKVLVVDDVLATGGTLEATIQLVEKVGGEISGIAVLIDLVQLHAEDILSPYKFFSLMDI